MMRYYPIGLDIEDKNCLVVGGGKVGLRKTITLLECRARVTVVSKVFSKGFNRLDNNLSLVSRHFESTDLDGMVLVFGTTDNYQVNQQVKKEARKRNILCNIADDPDGSGFILPAIVRRGDLVLTVSTSGTSPAFAKHLRQKLEKQFDPYYADFLCLMGQLRQKLLQKNHAPCEHQQIFTTLIEKGLLDMVAHKDVEKINQLIKQVAQLDIACDTIIDMKG